MSGMQEQQQQPQQLVREKEFGSWKSPISSQLATASAVGLSELHLDRAVGQQDVVYWIEVRFEEGGRYVVCSSKAGESESKTCTPSEFNARTKVHEYGGGSCMVQAGNAYFSNFEDQRMYVMRLGADKAQPISPADSGWRFADAMFSPNHSLIYCVREDHSKIKTKERKEAENTVVVINPETQAQTVLASGCDFYSSPQVSPDGKKIAWMQWVHPNMPWDDTEIWVADLTPSGVGLVPGSAKKAAGGEGISVTYPRWTPDNELLYIGDVSNWWNLYHVTSGGEHVNLHAVDAEADEPHWKFANYPYDCDPTGSGKIVTRYAGKLGILDAKTKEYKEIETGYASHNHVQFAATGHIYCIAGSPNKLSAVLRVEASTGKVEVVKAAGTLSVDAGYLSVPEEIRWPTGEGQTSYGVFYPPKNKDFTGVAGSLPPLLVKVHGGPTGSCSSDLSLEMQYFTSRGFALLDVNYRGSTGYGTKYRHSLRTNWGVYDIADCSSGAQHLAQSNKVDGNKLCIDGGSAGGYTTLACLAFTDVFKAGASYYGIGDLSILAAETHKFESRYVATLIAPYTPENQHIFDERSPIKHIDKFNCPIAFFQGDEDEVVPKNQAVMMFEAVKTKGLRCSLLMFAGEQHGFVKAENMQKALDGEFYFYSQVFGFKPADQGIEIIIENL